MTSKKRKITAMSAEALYSIKNKYWDAKNSHKCSDMIKIISFNFELTVTRQTKGRL